ncbi:pantoate--beta-alanine ligase [Nesterenkonia populi]|uniref:pantoate--beta-alanine ligase n=1 Tax=Nesterenkonia populi TaxID=1591087 RepID=UPI001B8858F5|nr:pantoate--beta-alanine ligase [Nesterenkonia populi]
MSQIFRTVPEFQAALAEAVSRTPAEPAVVGFVPTLGALHSGHGALLRSARETSDVMVASVFVNPLQFDDDADYLHYPRQLESDAALLAEHGTDLILAPELEEMYPSHPGDAEAPAPQLRVSAGEMGRMWEGASRPGHFDGVATVVAKLFSIVAAPLGGAKLEAWFGEKDAEQLAIIRRLVTDLSLPATVRALPTVRDQNGLALSSRNQRLSAEEYDSALALSRALRALAGQAEAGEPLDVDRQAAQLNAAEGVDLDYLVVVDPSTLREVDLQEAVPLAREALALIAARVGPVRLIDNMRLVPTV